MNSILELAPIFNEAYDANTKEAHAYFSKVENWLGEQKNSIDEIDNEARSLGDEAFAFRVMLKFIKSKRIIENLDKPVYLTLINPVYKEKGRMQRREEHPHGENSLRTKINVLSFFESLNSHFKGRIIVVDDGCPENSGDMAEDIFKEFLNSPHRVFWLSKAIDSGDKDLPPGITHKSGSNRSVKGGAALFGMRKALKMKSEGLHIVVDNDADLSVHPMQLGLLLENILDGDVKAIAGSRREDDSVALIGGSRNVRGNLFIQIWQHFLPQLANQITDTNRAFKAFEAKALEKIIDKIKIYTFPYQIELLQACISSDIPLIKKGIAYIDSEAASTQSGENITETYLNQIHQIIDIAKRYNTIHFEDQLLKFFTEISEEEWLEIEKNPPKDIKELIK